MKKLSFLFAILMIAAVSLFAQAPQKFSYQAVVRNANNQLVTSQAVGVRVSILQGGVSGTVVYMETQTAVTNTNGLITLQIGGGNVLSGNFATIDWSDGPFFLKTETDPAGGTNYSIEGTQQLLSVPYALYAGASANGFSGDYNDLTNTPTMPVVPTDVSSFTNDAGYITSYTETDPLFNAWDKDYNDLINTPTIPNIPTNVSTFTNDAGYVTTSQLNAANYITLSQVPAQVNADWNATSGAAQILNKPALFSGNYNDLSNKPNLSTVATTGNYSDLVNKPTLFDGNYNSLSNMPNLATVATTGNYTDLTNRPTIPTVPSNVSAFTNDAGYVTSADVQQAAGIPTVVSAFQNDMGYVTTSQLNQANYITLSQVPAQVNADWNATSGVAKILNKPTLFSGNYNDLSNKPTIPTVPSNVSVFNNDAHYITEAQLNALLASMNNTIDSLRDRIEDLETNPAQPHSGLPVDGYACPDMLTVTDYDRNVYPTIQIGSQCWMKENLRSTHYSDGTAITAGNSSSTTVAYYYTLQGNFNYGYLYNWKAVMRSSSSSQASPSGVQGICPNGWHVPSDAEWDELQNYVSNLSQYRCNDNSNYIAKALAATEGWSSSTSTCAVGNALDNNNATGFSALPAGYYSGGSYTGFGTTSLFWSSTESSNSNTYDRSLDYSNAVMTRSSHVKSCGLSVRCLRDGGNTTQYPMVSTKAVTSITATTAVSGGTVTDDGGYEVTAHGVCWSTSHNPTIVNNDRVTSDGIGMGEFTSNITGLTPGTTYYVKAYATNEHGTNYGLEESFTTPIPFICGTNTVTDYDNNVYNTVQIGEQCWMKENMRVTHYANGTAITQASLSQYSTTTRYYYNPGHATNYGYLYNWPAATGYGVSAVSANNQGICPTGWHVPSDGEWTQLTQYVGSQSQYLCSNNSTYIAKALASSTGWNSSTTTCAVGNTPGSNNATGFSALPAGHYRYESSSDYGFYGSGSNAAFWSSTETGSSFGYYRSLSYDNANVTSGGRKYYGYSVRCLRD